MGNAIPYTQPKSQNPNQDEAEEHQKEETFTCEICMEQITLPNRKFKNSNRCVHPFCTDCMIKYIQVKLEDNVSDIKCPATTCDHSFDPLSCRPKIPNQLFIQWCDELCESTVLGVNSVYCPNNECSELILDECDKGNLTRCVCPNYKKPFCFECKVAWHAGYTCIESDVTGDANAVAFGVLAETNAWQRCPMCRHCVERSGGCNVINCRCGVAFCYRCGERLRACKCISTNFHYFSGFFQSFILLLFLAIFDGCSYFLLITSVLHALAFFFVIRPNYLDRFLYLVVHVYGRIIEGWSLFSQRKINLWWR